MTHLNYQLTPNQVRNRLVSYKQESKPEPADDPNKADTHEEFLLFGLVAGESILFNKSVRLRVIHGCVEIGGHVYSVMDTYRKFVVPPWVPSERMLCLCYKTPPNSNESNYLHTNTENNCSQCIDVLNKLYGGTCCEFVSRYLTNRENVMKHFGLEDCGLPITGQKYSEYVQYYQSQMGREFDTVLMLDDYVSCFGTVSASHSLEALGPPRFVSNQMLSVCEELLKLCMSGSNPILMLYGDKGTGKSTIVTYVINYLLNFITNVCLLDVDVGQPLVSAPGLVTLTYFSESITSPCHSLVKDVRPKLSLLMGDVKVSNSLLLLRHVKRCLDYYERTQRNFKAPLVINTFGWTSGIGGQIIEGIGAVAKVKILLKLLCFQKPNQMISITNHEELKYYLDQIDLENNEFSSQPNELVYIDTFPLFGNVVEELGGRLPWNAEKEYYMPSFQNYQNLFKNCNFKEGCGFNQLHLLTFKRDLVTPSDTRWLRFCSYLNNSFSDALHFPQLRHEEFFGNVETYNFMHNIKFPNKFHTPKQIQLNITEYMVVTQSDILPKTHEELVPMISGSIVGLCKGHKTDSFRTKLSHHWDFISYAYVHYLNPEDLSMLISYPKYKCPDEIKSSNILVMCLSYGFEPCPSKLCRINNYPSNITPKLEYLSSQIYPFRRNELLHMFGSFGAGTSAPTQRSNLKRAKKDNQN